jgi:hypothetical protein
MADLAARIRALDADTAARVLSAVARYRVNNKLATEVTPDAALADELAAAAPPDVGATAGDLARAALLLLADDPEVASAVEGMLDNAPAASFSLGGLALGTAVLIVLQSYIKVERTKEGKWTFKFEKQPMDKSQLTAVIAKLGGWIKAG